MQSARELTVRLISCVFCLGVKRDKACNVMHWINCFKFLSLSLYLVSSLISSRHSLSETDALSLALERVCGGSGKKREPLVSRRSA